MRPEIAGLTAEEWLALDDVVRAQLIAVALPREDRSTVAALVEMLAAPEPIPPR